MSNPNSPSTSMWWNLRLVKFKGAEQPMILPVFYHRNLVPKPLFIYDKIMNKINSSMIQEAFENNILEAK